MKESTNSLAQRAATSLYRLLLYKNVHGARQNDFGRNVTANEEVLMQCNVPGNRGIISEMCGAQEREER